MSPWGKKILAEKMIWGLTLWRLSLAPGFSTHSNFSSFSYPSIAG
jgi:hypothetical protein